MISGKRQAWGMRIKPRVILLLTILAVVLIPLLTWASNQAHPKDSQTGPQKFGFVDPGGSYDGLNVSQPIAFPHNVHVKDNKINCLYCHTYARRSKVAGIPPLSKCMGCHSVIAVDTDRIKRLTEYWDKQQAPAWKKVHDLPDFVHFSHEKHLQHFVFKPNYPVENVKDICAFCHGEVESMTVARKVKPLTMGWCQRCHQANQGPSNCWACHK